MLTLVAIAIPEWNIKMLVNLQQQKKNIILMGFRYTPSVYLDSTCDMFMKNNQIQSHLEMALIITQKTTI